MVYDCKISLTYHWGQKDCLPNLSFFFRKIWSRSAALKQGCMELFLLTSMLRYKQNLFQRLPPITFLAKFLARLFFRKFLLFDLGNNRAALRSQEGENSGRKGKVGKGKKKERRTRRKWSIFEDLHCEQSRIR